MPLVSCAAAEKIVNPVNPWVFNTPQLDRHAVSKILQDAKAKGYAKLAILTVSVWLSQQMAQQVHGLETGAAFWHMVDLLWIVLFPLVYVVR